jgi:hypothetical protein
MLLKLRLIQDRDGFQGTVVCDQCGGEISYPNEGYHEWQIGSGVPESLQPYYTHRSCHLAFEEQRGGRANWLPLPLFLFPPNFTDICSSDIHLVAVSSYWVICFERQEKQLQQLWTLGPPPTDYVFTPSFTVRNGVVTGGLDMTCYLDSLWFTMNAATGEILKDYAGGLVVTLCRDSKPHRFGDDF